MCITSSEIKMTLLYHFRIVKNYYYVATEAGPFNADVLASNEKKLLECEVKINTQDLKNEFKKFKHQAYNNPYYKLKTPTHFYIAVPDYLLDETTYITPEKYGIILVTPPTITVIKKPTQLAPFSQILLNQLVKRMSSELLNFHMKKTDWK